MYWREGGIGGEGTGYLRQEACIGGEGVVGIGQKVRRCVFQGRSGYWRKDSHWRREGIGGEGRRYRKLGDEFRREGSGRGGAKGNIGGIKSALCLEGVLY